MAFDELIKLAAGAGVVWGAEGGCGTGRTMRGPDAPGAAFTNWVFAASAPLGLTADASAQELRYALEGKGLASGPRRRPALSTAHLSSWRLDCQNLGRAQRELGSMPGERSRAAGSDRAYRTAGAGAVLAAGSGQRAAGSLRGPTRTVGWPRRSGRRPGIWSTGSAVRGRRPDLPGSGSPEDLVGVLRAEWVRDRRDLAAKEGDRLIADTRLTPARFVPLVAESMAHPARSSCWPCSGPTVSPWPTTTP